MSEHGERTIPHTASTLTVAQSPESDEVVLPTPLPIAQSPICIDEKRHFDDEEFPEGGRDAWLACAGSFLVYFVCFGFINSYGVFQEYYSSEYINESSGLSIAFIGSLQTALFYLDGIFVGALFDSIGLKLLYPLGGLGCTLALVALSFTKPNQIWQQFLSQGVLFGASMGVASYPALAVGGQYFKRRRGLVMGITASGSSVGGVCFPIMFSKLFPTIGFAWAVRVAALVSFVCFSIAILISRTRLPPRKLTSVRALIDLDGFKDWRFNLIVLGSFLTNFGLYTPHYFAESYAIKIGASPQIYTYILPMLNGTSFFGRLLGGYLADRWGRLNVLAPGTLLSGLLCFILWLPFTNPAALVVFVCVYGFMTGIFISVGPAAIGQISPTDKLGARIGTYCGLMAFAVVLGTPISGGLTGSGERKDFIGTISYAGAMVTAGGVVLYIARIVTSRNLRDKW